MWSKILKVLKGTGSFILRRGPIIAAALTGLGAVPELFQYVKWGINLLGIFGVQPDPTLTTPSGELVTQLALLVGAIRKIWSIIQQFRGKKL